MYLKIVNYHSIIIECTRAVHAPFDGACTGESRYAHEVKFLFWGANFGGIGKISLRVCRVLFFSTPSDLWWSKSDVGNFVSVVSPDFTICWESSIRDARAMFRTQMEHKKVHSPHFWLEAGSESRLKVCHDESIIDGAGTVHVQRKDKYFLPTPFVVPHKMWSKKILSILKVLCEM